MEKSKSTNGIGHNSKVNEVAYYGQPPITKAVLELAKMARENCAKALKLLEQIQKKYQLAFKGEEPLTKEQSDINWKAEQYNKNILKNQDVFSRHKLRKTIKPRKLNVHEKHNQFHEAEDNYFSCWEELNSAEAELRQLLDQRSVLGMVAESELQNVKRGNNEKDH